MDQRDIFGVVIYISYICRTPGGLAVGCVNVEIERLSSNELIFIGVLTT